MTMGMKAATAASVRTAQVRHNTSRMFHGLYVGRVTIFSGMSLPKQAHRQHVTKGTALLGAQQ
jgi:hypothetical protein